jgi:hypothetical protein
LFSWIEKSYLYENLDVELYPNDDATTKEAYKQRFFQLLNSSEVRIFQRLFILLSWKASRKHLSKNRSIHYTKLM